MDTILTYIKESYYELMNKVVWPSWASLLATSRVVIVASIIFTLLVFAMGIISNKALGLIYGI